MCSVAHCQLTCDLRPALEEGGEFVGGAEVAVARLTLVDRAIGDVVGVFDQAKFAGPAILVEREIFSLSTNPFPTCAQRLSLRNCLNKVENSLITYRVF